MNNFAGGYVESLLPLSVEEGWSVFKAKLQSTIENDQFQTTPPLDHPIDQKDDKEETEAVQQG